MAAGRDVESETALNGIRTGVEVGSMMNTACDGGIDAAMTGAPSGARPFKGTGGRSVSAATTLLRVDDVRCDAAFGGTVASRLPPQRALRACDRDDSLSVGVAGFEVPERIGDGSERITAVDRRTKGA